MALLSTGTLTDYDEECCPKDQQVSFDYDHPIELLNEIPLSVHNYHLDLDCNGVTVEEGLKLLDQVQCTSVPSPASDCSWDSGIPSTLATTDEQFLAGLFGTDIPLTPHMYSPTPSPTELQTFSPTPRSQLSREAKYRTSGRSVDIDEGEHQADKSRGGKVSESMADRNRKNAEAAKQNRLKKKKYMEDLEKNCASLKTENVVLKTKCHEYQTKCQRLQSEVTYLQSVLANDSVLASLLQNIPNVPKVKLTSSLGKRLNTSSHANASKKSKLSGTTGGVCLHVAKGAVSLEFCSTCSRTASTE
jgi:hypothetical protein